MKNGLGAWWPILLGGFGFVVGFFGPIILSPTANQGPLLGILITGPGGIICGSLLWGLTKIFRWNPNTQVRILTVCCGLLLISVVTVALAPKPNWVGRLYDIEVMSCRPVQQEAPLIVSQWTSRMAAYSWKSPKPDWQKEVEQIVAASSGTVVEVKILGEKIVKKESPFFRPVFFSAALLVSKSPQVLTFYFSGSCDQMPTGKRGSHFVRIDGMNIMPTQKGEWPPSGIADLLIKATLLPVPPELSHL